MTAPWPLGGLRANHLIIFLKAPRPGSVKTRLANSIGAEQACAAYCTLVNVLLDRLGGNPGVELRFTPDDAFDEIRPWLQQSWTAAPQGAGGLGERLKLAFAESCSAGATRTVIIGSDCPDAAWSDIEAAWSALEQDDLVLGPATDGGYWLIGLREPRASLFEGIAWGSHQVLEQTLERAAAASLRVHLLRKLSDVDTEEDWQRFRGRSGKR